MTTSGSVGRAQYLTFAVAGEDYGIPVLTVREVLEYDALAEVPGTPGVAGGIDLRGRSLPVVDVAARLGLPASAATPRTCVVVVEAVLDGERVAIGLRVDAVDRVVELDAAEIEEAPRSPGGRAADCLVGLGRLGARPVLLLDVDRVPGRSEGQP